MVVSSSVFLFVSTYDLITLSKSIGRFIYNGLLLTPVLMVLFSYLTYDQNDIILQDYCGLVFLTQSIVYAIITAKMIVFAMAKADQYSII